MTNEGPSGLESREADQGDREALVERIKARWHDAGFMDLTDEDGDDLANVALAVIEAEQGAKAPYCPICKEEGESVGVYGSYNRIPCPRHPEQGASQSVAEAREAVIEAYPLWENVDTALDALIAAVRFERDSTVGQA